MVKRDDIIKELKNRGYDVEAHTSIKNGVEVNGICLRDGTEIGTVIYTDRIEKNSETLSAAAEEVLNVYNDAGEIEIDPDILKDANYIMKNLYIGLQKSSIENIVKSETDFEGIEKYLYIRISEIGICKLQRPLMENLMIDENEAWKLGESHTFSETKIESIEDMLSEISGQDTGGGLDGVPTMYVVTNNRKLLGASAILDKFALKNLAGRCNANRFIVFPSSVHEMIAVPDDGKNNIDELNEMVREINEDEVDPEERLADRVYIIKAR